MSYCYFHGIMPVCDGQKVQTVRGNGTVAWHVLYDSIFYLETGIDLEGKLRSYSPPSSSILPNDKLIMVHGKFAVFSNHENGTPLSFIVDTIRSVPFDADPVIAGFDSFLPEDNVPYLSLLGVVVGSLVQMAEDGKAIDVKVSSFVQNKSIESTYRSVFIRFRMRLELICLF